VCDTSVTYALWEKCSGKYCKIFLFQKCHTKGSATNWKILKLLSAAQK
jgi:hypothetical protein